MAALGLGAIFILSMVSSALGSRWDHLIAIEAGLLTALAFARPSELLLFLMPLAVLTADCLGMLLSTTPHHPLDLTYSLSETVQVLLTVFLVEKVLGRRVQIKKTKDFFIFTTITGVAALPYLTFTLTGYFLQIVGPSELLHAAQFALLMSLGIITLTPLTLLLLSRGDADYSKGRRWEALILGILTVLGAVFVFSSPTSSLGSTLGSPPFRYALFPLLIWSAVRFGALGASLTSSSITAIAAMQLARRAGPFAGLSGTELAMAVELVQVYLATLQISSLGLGISLEELAKTHWKLSESELRFRYATLGSNTGLWNWDTKSKRLELNARGHELLGSSATATTWDKDFALAQVYPEDRDRLLEQGRASLRNGCPFDETVRVRSHDGLLRWVQIHGVSFADPYTHQTWLSGSFSDITAETSRLRLLEQLVSGSSLEIVLGHIVSNLELQLRGAQVAILSFVPGTSATKIESAPNLAPEVRRVIETTTPSPRSCCLGASLYAHRRVIAEDLPSLPPSDESRLFLEHTRVRAIWSEPVSVELCDCNRIVSVFFETPRAPTQNELTLLQEAASLAGIAISRTRTLAVLQEKEEALERTLATVSGLAYRVPPYDQGCFTYARGGCLELTGYHSSELTAQPTLTFISLVAPQDRQRAAAKFDHFKVLRDPYDIDYRIMTRTGEVKWVRDQSHGVYDSRGTLVAIEGLLTDITLPKRSEEQRLALEEQLRQATKMEAIGTLAGGIAHDFNNILASIIGFTELAKRKAAPAEPITENLEHVLAAALRARNLVGQILTFSRKDDSEARPLSLAATINESLPFLRATIPSSISINTSLDTAAPLIKANATQIHQVLLNLAGNAADAIGEQGGKIEIALSQKVVGTIQRESMPELSPGKYLVVTFRDSGAGIPKEAIPRIFDPFFTTKAVGKGTGLGLSVVHGIMRSHGGTVRVESSPDQGTIFSLYFPVAVGQFAEERHEAPSIPMGSGERILFVDDEEGLVTLATQILSDLNYRVSGYSSSSAAWEVFNKNPSAFDLVITDKTMPELTGVELLKLIKKRSPEIPVIMITGLVGEEIEHLAQSTQEVSVLLKPYTTPVLATLIRSLLRGKTIQASMPAEAPLH